MNTEVFYKMESKSGSGNTRWSPKNLSQKEVCAYEPLLEQTELIQHNCPVQTALTQTPRITEAGKVPQDHWVQPVQPAPPRQPDPTQISPVTSLLDRDAFEFPSLSFPLLIYFPCSETQLWLINLIIRLFSFFFFSGRPVLWCYFWATYASWRCFCQGFWEQVVNSTDRGEREINTGLCFVGTNIFSSLWPWPLRDRCHVSCPRLRSDITSPVSQCVLRWEPK